LATGDQENESNGGQEHQESGANAAYDFGLERETHQGVNLRIEVVLVRGLVLLGRSGDIGGHFRLRLRGRDAGLQESEQIKVV
jgi:hypothetical protein